MGIINEFIEALDAEITALKSGKGGNTAYVHNGQMIRSLFEFHIYEFTLESFLIAMDDMPAIIEVKNTEYECDIISVNGLKVQISIKEYLGKTIPKAKIITKAWYILERLKKKYEENLDNKSKFEQSNKLFQNNN